MSIEIELNEHFSIYRSLGGERDVGLNDDDQLLFRHGLARLCMGHTTKKTIDNLCESLQRLKIHLPD